MILALACALAFPGCNFLKPERRCAPPCPESFTDPVDGTRNSNAPSAELFRQLADGLQGPSRPMPDGSRMYNVLAISGGGKFGAYSAGVLGGWTESGNRPSFDVVTGVSTGAIVAVFAFLGPKYDDTVRRFYTTVTDKDIYRKKPLPFALLGDSLASSEPLKRGIERAVTPELIADLAQAHAEGRRLLIGTTNLDTKRLAVWDISAIAAGDRCDKHELISKIILASTSVPGQFPPVKFDVTVNGIRYTELHGDGGASSEVFVRLAHLNVPLEQLRAGPRPLVGSNIYAIVSGKVFAEPKCVNPNLFGILGGAITSLVSAMTQNDLLRIYTLSLLTGMQFQFTALRQDFVDEGGPLKFEPLMLARLYEEGRRVGLQGGRGPDWRTQPPAVLRHEQVVPRTGTEFEGR
ncbi:MAG: patatin-like phospholipase family protein [Gemmataceae bacterium]|nr:patatin-like phospholipase family protein [Planctomycetia bacterium]MBX3398947.1 patatin-like phospholipase family protein [Gemmataceae bacterium]